MGDLRLVLIAMNVKSISAIVEPRVGIESMREMLGLGTGGLKQSLGEPG